MFANVPARMVVSSASLNRRLRGCADAAGAAGWLWSGTAVASCHRCSPFGCTERVIKTLYGHPTMRVPRRRTRRPPASAPSAPHQGRFGGGALPRSQRRHAPQTPELRVLKAKPRPAAWANAALRASSKDENVPCKTALKVAGGPS